MTEELSQPLMRSMYTGKWEGTGRRPERLSKASLGPNDAFKIRGNSSGWFSRSPLPGKA